MMRVTRVMCARCRLRGTGGDLIILEEAAFISSEVWTEVGGSPRVATDRTEPPSVCAQ